MLLLRAAKVGAKIVRMLSVIDVFLWSSNFVYLSQN